ncbi:MAG: Stealth CR1 domain-containing protein, partial [Prevotella sp.]|nr:Stealth CR1 domain-containing protein [Prevotella sp.]
MDIDFVVTWVDMTDPVWSREFAKYRNAGRTERNGVSQARFRDAGLLKYWFRGVDKFAPWVRRIYFVTCGQTPAWLNTKNPKLRLINHRDIIPEEFLPTFNSVVIERYMHRIPGLAEHFVYFNDDFYIISRVGTERFFRDGLPCDIAAFTYNPSWSQWYATLRNNARLINRHFDKREVMKRDRDKWFNRSYGRRALWNYLLRRYNK